VALEGLRRYGEIAEMRILIESLRGELPGPDPLRQQYSAEALGALRDAEGVPRLIELVKHDEAAVVLAARHALLEITKQDFGTSRWRWRSWWERHRGEPRVEWMLEGLGHGEAEVRESASEELRTLSADSFGYHFDLPKREREEARKRWVDWWRAQKKN
jgi:HEAT repeat protein